MEATPYARPCIRIRLPSSFGPVTQMPASPSRQTTSSCLTSSKAIWRSLSSSIRTGFFVCPTRRVFRYALSRQIERNLRASACSLDYPLALQSWLDRVAARRLDIVANRRPRACVGLFRRTKPIASGLRMTQDETDARRVHISVAALPRWRRRRSSSSSSSPRRHALPHRHQPQAHRLARAG